MLYKTFSRSLAIPKLREKIINVFGEKAYTRLVKMEETFFAAELCHKRLKNRSDRYGRILFTFPNLYLNGTLRKLHADEYFSFICYGNLFKELTLFQKQGILPDIPADLMEKLKALKDERRYHEHGQDCIGAMFSLIIRQFLPVVITTTLIKIKRFLTRSIDLSPQSFANGTNL